MAHRDADLEDREETISSATIQITFRTPDASQAAARFAGNGCSIGKKRNKGLARVWRPELVDFYRVGRHERAGGHRYRALTGSHPAGGVAPCHERARDD